MHFRPSAKPGFSVCIPCERLTVTKEMRSLKGHQSLERHLKKVHMLREPVKKQGTVDAGVMPKRQKLPPDQQDQLTRNLAIGLIMADTPLDVMDDEYLRCCLQSLNPRYRCAPCCSFRNVEAPHCSCIA